MAEWLGRFHPLLIHFPIGILVMAAAAVLLLKGKSFEKYRSTIRFLYLVGTLFVGLSIASGLILAQSASYEYDNLFWHKWSGIGLGILGLTLFYIVPLQRYKSLILILNIGLLILLAIAGHLGGRMTHGPDYLLPRTRMEMRSVQAQINDSSSLFESLIFPIFQEKCIRCHQERTQNGGLDMSSAKGLLRGGDGGEIIQPGNAYKSKIFKRVSLPANHPKFMPPNGIGLTYDEVRLLEWWIESGATLDKKIGVLERTPQITQYLERQYGLRSRTEDPLSNMQVPPVSPGLIDSVSKNGFNIKSISSGKNIVDIVPIKPNQLFSKTQLTSLLLMKEQIVWLNLAGSNLDDESMEIIGQLSNLRKLNLEHNPITDKSLKSIEGLDKLECLNLFNTRVSAAGVNNLSRWPALTELYLGQTMVDQDVIKALRQQYSQIEIVGNAVPFEFEK